MPVLPNGDHYIFLAPDLRFGIDANCAEQTIRVFGQPLLDALAVDPPLLFDRPTWASEERAALRTGWEQLGWRRLTCDERDDYRDEFFERFDFRPSRSPAEGPCFREPVPSVTWDISEVLLVGADQKVRHAALTLKILSAFRRVASPGGQLLALDAVRFYEHYSFDPHLLSEAGRDEWALPVVPDRAFSIFVAPDFSFGLVGNPVEQTVCVFGQPLLDAVLSAPPTGFGAVLRCDGQPMDPTSSPSQPNTSEASGHDSQALADCWRVHRAT